MLKERVITAILLLIAVALVLFVLPPVFFSGFILLVILLAAWEWARLSGLEDSTYRIGYAVAVTVLVILLYLLPTSVQLFLARITCIAALGFWGFALYCLVAKPELVATRQTFDRTLLATGVFVLLSTALSLTILRYHASQQSVWLLLYVLSLVWVMDIGAYFSGRRFGKTKLAPLISPGKTREGVYGGIAGAICLVIFALLLHEPFRQQAFLFLLASIAAALISVAGDLYVSRLKRSRGIKDSSQILPGHGGVMDRIDGVVAAVPVFLGIWIWA